MKLATHVHTFAAMSNQFRRNNYLRHLFLTETAPFPINKSNPLFCHRLTTLFPPPHMAKEANDLNGPFRNGRTTPTSLNYSRQFDTNTKTYDHADLTP